MIKLFWLFIGVPAWAAFHLPHFHLEKNIYDTDRRDFLRHEGKGTFDNWVAIDVPVAPLQKLTKQIEDFYQVHLLTRPEAHVTVLTPLEIPRLHSKLSAAQINQSVEGELQRKKFQAVCLGRGEIAIDGKKEAAFFVVLNAPELVEVRKGLQRTFEEAGGKGGIDPEEFFPHITVGFTKRDLHLEDGVVKDFRSCVARLD